MPIPLSSRGVRRRLSPVLLALLALLGTGCNLINPDEPIPAYLRIEKFDYTPAAGAPLTSNATDAWVYVDSKFLGAFELPVTVPVLKSGPTPVTVLPGIYADGQKGARLIYPFYSKLITTINFVPKETTRLTPPLAFDPTVTHAFDEVSEDFTTDNDPAFVLKSVNSDYRLRPNVRTDPSGLSLQIPAAFGGVGLVQGIAGRNDVFFLDSRFYNFLPQKGAPVYLELDYRSTMPFQVGIAWSTSPTQTGANLTRSSELTVFPKEEWTKLYVNLTDEISYVNNPAAKFVIYLEGFPTTDAGQYLAIDNVRLVRDK